MHNRGTFSGRLIPHTAKPWASTVPSTSPSLITQTHFLSPQWGTCHEPSLTCTETEQGRQIHDHAASRMLMQQLRLITTVNMVAQPVNLSIKHTLVLASSFADWLSSVYRKRRQKLLQQLVWNQYERDQLAQRAKKKKKNPETYTASKSRSRQTKNRFKFEVVLCTNYWLEEDCGVPSLLRWRARESREISVL